MNEITFAGNCENLGKEIKLRSFIVFAAGCDGKIRHEKGELSFQKGDIVAIPPLCAHTIYCDSGVCVHMDKTVIPLNAIAVFADDGANGAAHAIKQAAAYINDPLMLEAFGGLIAAYVTAKTRRGNLSPVTLTVRDDIEAHISDSSYNLEERLKKLPLNYDYIRKLFQKETGSTPHAYLVSLRMKLAAQIILSGISNKYSNYTVSQIAEACGFAEPLYFSRAFKKYYGKSPTEYARLTLQN